MMCWPDSGQEPTVKITILEDDTLSKSGAEARNGRGEVVPACSEWMGLKQTMEEQEM